MTSLPRPGILVLTLAPGLLVRLTGKRWQFSISPSPSFLDLTMLTMLTLLQIRWKRRRERGLERGGHQVPECRFVFVIVCGCCGVFIFVDLLLFAVAHVIVTVCCCLLLLLQIHIQSAQGEFWMTYTDFIRTFTHLEVK